MTKRSCVPRPIIPMPSEASISNVILRPSTALTIAFAVTVAPSGVGASWVMDKAIPTVPSLSS